VKKERELRREEIEITQKITQKNTYQRERKARARDIRFTEISKSTVDEKVIFEALRLKALHFFLPSYYICLERNTK
jgi:hypothetical protein